MAEVLSHAADAAIALAFRIRQIATEPGGPLVAWDQDRRAEHDLNHLGENGAAHRQPARRARSS